MSEQHAVAQPGLEELASSLHEVLGAQLGASRQDVGQAQTLMLDAIERLMRALPDVNGAAGEAQGTAGLRQAIVNLQFQDLVSQLLRRADDRMAALQGLLADLERILAKSKPLHEAIGHLRAHAVAHTGNAVQQVDMAPGDVELF